MFLSGRVLHTSVVSAGIAVLVFSSISGLQYSFGSNKAAVAAVNEFGTIVVSRTTEPSDSPFEDIFPKDGKIEGKNVTSLSPTGINNLGQIVGLCELDESAEKYPFVREPDGRFWIFKTPSSSGQGEFTDISDSGKAVGFYEREAAQTKLGFLMDPYGRWVMDIEYPSNPCPAGRSHLHTQPNGINNRDEIVGNYECTERPDDTADPLFKGNGFYRAPDGTFYAVQYENAIRTVAGKISNDGVIFGYYAVDNDTWIPFAATKDEVIKSLVR